MARYCVKYWKAALLIAGFALLKTLFGWGFSTVLLIIGLAVYWAGTNKRMLPNDPSHRPDPIMHDHAAFVTQTSQLGIDPVDPPHCS